MKSENYAMVAQLKYFISMFVNFNNENYAVGCFLRTN